MSTRHTVTRRDFIRTTTAASALAMTAKGYAQTPGANNRLRMAFIGCGTIATHHLEKLLKIREDENLELAAVCDVYTRRAENFQGKIKEAGGSADLHKD